MNEKKNERDFSPELLIEWGIHETEDCEHVVSCTYSGFQNDYIDQDVVFRAPDDGRLWMFRYEFAPTAGVNNIENNHSPIVGFAVEPYEVKITKYRKIQQEEAPHQNSEQGDVIESVARQIIDVDASCSTFVESALRVAEFLVKDSHDVDFKRGALKYAMNEILKYERRRKS